MNTRLVATLVGMGVVIGLLAGLLIGALLFREAPQAAALATTPVRTRYQAPQRAEPENPRQVDVELPAERTVPTPPPAISAPPEGKPLMQFADRICQGDTNAVPELAAAVNKLYEGIDYQRDAERVRSNYVVVDAAFQKIGVEAGRNSPSALAALQQSLDAGMAMNGFATRGLGAAAAAGNEEALDMLLHHDEFGILKSGAVSALSGPATKGNQDAVAFLIGILEDESARPLWQMASDTLRKCAALGDAEAMAAVNRHDARSRR